MKKIIKISIMMMVLISVLMPNFVVSADDSFIEFCMNNIDDAQCANYKSLRSSQASVDEISQNIDAYGIELNNYQQAMVQMNQQLLQTQTDIGILQQEITETESDIVLKEEDVAQKKVEMDAYMVQSQSTMRVNGYIEFIMKAGSFADIVRRFEGMSLIKTANGNIVDEYRSTIEALNQTKTTLDTAQNTLVEKQASLTVQIEETEIMKANLDRIVDELMVQKQNMMHEIEVIQEKVAIDDANFNIVGGVIARPLQSDYYVSAGVWQYPSGGTHVGVDLAPNSRNVGMELLAPGNGIVVAMKDGCETWGWYGSSCNGGYGNYINLIVSDGTTSYGILYGHLVQNSFTVRVGQSVNVGDVVGLLGSSGSSTGPHVHAEVYNLGNISVKEAYDNWNGSNTFGTGSASNGGMSHLCSNSSAPCRENPQEIWGYEVGRSY